MKFNATSSMLTATSKGVGAFGGNIFASSAQVSTTSIKTANGFPWEQMQILLC